jgi:acyl-CoA synthetase (AMP-forming)/AMP-acid ligase II
VSTPLVDATTSVQPPAVLTALPVSRALSDPAGRCLVDETRSLDNAAFAADVAALEARFAALGIGVGDVVAVLLPNRFEILTTMFAAWRRGAALTPVNPALTDDEIGYQLRDSDTRLLVGDERSEGLARELGIAHVDVETVHGASVADLPAPEPVALTGNDHALIVYTSGTTCRPKGCVLDHGNVEAMVSSLVHHFRFGPGDRSLLVLPLHHCNGLMVGVLSMLLAGGSVAIGPRFEPAAFWAAVERHRPTYFSAVPTMYAVLNAHTARPADSSSLAFAICGAAPMSADLIGQFERRFGFPLIEGYGLSECSVAATINPLAGTRKPGTVGPALPNQIVAIEDHHGNRLPAGQPGEVVVKGPNVMRGYLGRPEDTARVLRDGWLHTGDVGYLDPDGYLVLVDRIKEMIIRGGENIYPKEIEDVLHGFEEVLEAAVVGQPDEVFGEVPVAYVVPRPGLSLDAETLRDRCLDRLARYKVPRDFRIIAGLPKSSVGKILKSELRS